MKHIKPPIGLMPYKFWLEYNPDPSPDDLLQRKYDLDMAIARYKQVNLPIPNNWTTK